VHATNFRRVQVKSILLMLLVSSAAFAQDRSIAAAETKYLLRVQSADTSKQAKMHIAWSGDLFGSLGGSKERPGSVSLGPGSAGTGTGTVLGSLFARPGRMTFSSDAGGSALEVTITAVSGAPTPRLVARGTSVSVVYSKAGLLSVETNP
jgi:hypothetical protein